MKRIDHYLFGGTNKFGGFLILSGKELLSTIPTLAFILESSCTIYQSLTMSINPKQKCNIPKWFVANCSSMLSLESMKGVAMIPALLLEIKMQKNHHVQHNFFKSANFCYTHYT